MVLGTVRDIFVRIVECLRLGLLKGFLLGHGFSEMYYIVTSGFASFTYSPYSFLHP